MLCHTIKGNGTLDSKISLLPPPPPPHVVGKYIAVIIDDTNVLKLLPLSFYSS